MSTPSTASIVVTFTDPAAAAAASAHLSAEIDSRPTGLNSGVTSFKPADVAWFLVFMSDNVELAMTPECSAGSIGIGGLVPDITRVEDVAFINADSVNLQVPADSITSVVWMGRSLGACTLDPVSKTLLKATDKGLAVARVTYKTHAESYSLTSPATLSGETSFSIQVLITGQLKA
jgi:hypothetical protein